MEMARTMLNESRLSNMFWPQVVHTVVHILTRSLLRNNNDKTPYHLWKGSSASIKHFRNFGSKFYIKIIDKKLEVNWIPELMKEYWLDIHVQ